MLFRSPGSSKPLQYSFRGACRSSCPAALARPSIYAAKRFSCGPGAERRDPTKQFYTRMFFYDPVVLARCLINLILELAENTGYCQAGFEDAMLDITRRFLGDVTWRYAPVRATWSFAAIVLRFHTDRIL